ncbi:CBS domain-containing protein [Corynebacterium qintianiae]|uniref:CBS domain-containing protein n=1 Tax=Corynebacterium qintianiae TaxID=2709392 RepID=UPI0013E9DB12|nr:CBS domain-containing protein [Corynebacterium qintianiae]
MEHNRATAFLAAFNDIEAFLRDVLNAKKSDGFTWMANLAAKKGHISRDQADDLKEYAELRNAISHGAYRDLRPIAEPLPETVSEIERIRDSLLSPALAMDVVGPQKVVTFEPGDDIHEPLAVIRDTDISQFPVYDGGECVGLLTTNAIARWVSADLGADDKLDAKTVGEALQYAETQDQAVFLPRQASAASAVEALTTPLGDGALPRLAIITEHGKPSQRPLAVVTASNIPELVAAI